MIVLTYAGRQTKKTNKQTHPTIDENILKIARTHARTHLASRKARSAASLPWPFPTRAFTWLLQ